MGHYDEFYFKWQKDAGELSGCANASKFKNSVGKKDVVLDFVRGGGWILKQLACKEPKAGLEVISVQDLYDKWPLHYEACARLGSTVFDIVSKAYGRIKIDQVRIIARNAAVDTSLEGNS